MNIYRLYSEIIEACGKLRGYYHLSGLGPEIKSTADSNEVADLWMTVSLCFLFTQLDTGVEDRYFIVVSESWLQIHGLFNNDFPLDK